MSGEFYTPFQIPGVRFPTDTTPPNERRLAENDALGRTCTDNRIFRGHTYVGTMRLLVLPPLGMVTLFIEEEGGADEGVEEEESK